MTEKVFNIVHFNDVYEIGPRAKDPVGGVTRFAAAVKKHAELKPMVLFSGDVFNPSVMSTITKGKHMIPILHELKVQASVVGNHEFDFGPAVLTKYITECKFPWLLSNVFNKETKGQLVNSKRHTIIEWEGVKVGLCGLAEREWLDTVSNVDSYAVYEDFVSEGKKLVEELRSEGADIVISLAHMRMNNCEKLAREVQGLDLILAGHDHFYEAKEVEGTKIILSGSDFRNFTVIKARKSPDAKWKFDTQQVDVVSSMPEDEEMIAIVKSVSSDVDKQMDKVLGSSSVILDATNANSRTKETNLGDLVADIMKRAFGTDIAFLNGGTIRSDNTYEPGNFTVKSLVSILPFPDTVVKISLTGEQLKSVLETSVSRFPAQDGRFLQISGFSFAFNPDKAAGERVEWVKVDGEPIDLKRRYTAATKAYIAAGSDGYDTLTSSEVMVDEENGLLLSCIVRKYFIEMNIIHRLGHKREAVSKALAKWEGKRAKGHVKDQNHYTVHPSLEGRIVNVKSG